MDALYAESVKVSVHCAMCIQAGAESEWEYDWLSGAHFMHFIFFVWYVDGRDEKSVVVWV